MSTWFPNRVWERGRIDSNGVQLWSSREATHADHERRAVIVKQLKGEQLTVWEAAIAEYSGIEV